MKVIYKTNKIEKQCTSFNDAKKLFGGNASLGISLLSRINALKGAETIKDIIVQPQFHFHDLHNKDRRNLDGFLRLMLKLEETNGELLYSL